MHREHVDLNCWRSNNTKSNSGACVKATRYGETRRPSSRRSLEKPAGEPRVERRREGGRNTLKTGTGVDTLDVPEFVPRG